MKRDFNKWLTTFRRSIANYGYYVDFAKVHANIEEIKITIIKYTKSLLLFITHILQQNIFF